MVDEVKVEAHVVDDGETKTGSAEFHADEPPKVEFTSEPNETAARAHATGEEIGRAITGVVVTGASFVVGLAKGIGKPIVDKVSEVSKNSQGADIGAQASEAFNRGVEAAEGWVGKTPAEAAPVEDKSPADETK